MLSGDSCQGHRKGLVSGLLLWYKLGKMLSASCGVNLAEGLMQGDMEIMFAFLVPECGWLS